MNMTLSSTWLTYSLPSSSLNTSVSFSLSLNLTFCLILVFGFVSDNLSNKIIVWSINKWEATPSTGKIDPPPLLYEPTPGSDTVVPLL